MTATQIILAGGRIAPEPAKSHRPPGSLSLGAFVAATGWASRRPRPAPKIVDLWNPSRRRFPRPTVKPSVVGNFKFFRRSDTAFVNFPP